MAYSFQVPPAIAKLLGTGELVRDVVGESPCEVFAWERGRERFFLKFSPVVYSSTTYSVKRESDVIAWLTGHLLVPDLVLYTEDEQGQYMVTKAVSGVPLSERTSSDKYAAEVYLEAIRQLRSIPIEACPFDSRVAVRLRELHYLRQNNLIADDCDFSRWPEIAGMDGLLERLDAATFREETVFSHGDLGDSNLFLDDEDRLHFLDLGRAGIADKWLDVSFAYASLCEDASPRVADAFLADLGEDDNASKRDFFQLLDEPF